jgi:hypothetical protein
MGGGTMDENRKTPRKISDKNLQTIVNFIESVQYGSVNIVIQDGNIVQIEKNEKVRLK